MIKHAFVLAVAAAALSTAAYAGDSKPVQMTDEQMDQVTAAGGNGAYTDGSPPGFSVLFPFAAEHHPLDASDNGRTQSGGKAARLGTQLRLGIALPVGAAS